jgi:hypothetical protein
MKTATYLYCLVAADKRPGLGAMPQGLPGTGAPRALEAGGGVWLIAADAPLQRYGEKAIEEGLKDLTWVSGCAVPHEAVVEHFARSGTVIPMKLFTLFNSDERALEHVRKDRRRIDRLVERLDGREEWGVRCILDEVSALRRARSEAAKEARGSPGAAFLLRKKKEADAARELLERARERAAGLFELLSRKADDARRRAPPPGEVGKRVLLDGAFLVRRGKVAAFKIALEREVKKLEPLGYQVTLTGPWPPYNFVAEAS